MDNTIKLIKKCKLGTIAGRLWGAKTGKGKVRLLKGAAKKRYYAIPESDRLTKRDIEQGTVLVSNLGSIYRGNMEPVLLDVIPPLVAAIGVGAFNERPGVVTAEDGSKSIAPRLYLPMTITFDHRACDAGILCRFSTAWMPFLPIRRKWKRGYRFVPLHKMHGGFLETAPDGYAERRFLLGIFMNRSRKNMAHCTKNDFRVCAMCLDFFAKMHILSIRAVKTRQSSKQRHRRKERRTMFDNRMDRDLIEMERKLLHEVTAQRGMSWRKFGKLLRLNAVVRAMERRDNSWRAY